MIGYNALTAADTIVALSTAPGVGAIAVIRLSGPRAFAITESVFHGKRLAEQPSHTLHFGTINNAEGVVDEVVAGIFKGPHSYTKEDVVEISCHGSPYIQQQIIELFIAQGARLAKPGEFTLRAFLNGRMDLSQAEAVADLIASQSAATHHIALRQMRGGFGNKIKQLRDKLVHFASMIELELDFGEEDVEFANRDDLKALINELLQVIHGLMESFKLGNVLRHGVSTVIVGRPNAGKSTLLNKLLNEERAIVSPIAGTTRDTIEETLNIDGILFRLIDTAGIREATDAIERIGVERTYEKIGSSALIIYLFDVEAMSPEMVEMDVQALNAHDIPLLLVGNKTDILGEAATKAKFAHQDMLFVSTLMETGLVQLKKALVEKVLGKDLLPDTIVVNARHQEALTISHRALSDVLHNLERGTTGDLLALDIRQALHALGEITGEITTDDLLDNIFSKFCIGK
ncbi:MAG: tRNA uridine-5-carboxymethylaminomethyl(34) synthesis GTPase MnmE [Chitinophagales bacterium]|nr:tRNA uridine-5-carboxymethylaminomethyl(34) synthesis GTPase MnmE [Chitinophagales bacterium]